jgi:hypothetical protein
LPVSSVNIASSTVKPSSALSTTAPVSHNFTSITSGTTTKTSIPSNVLLTKSQNEISMGVLDNLQVSYSVH